MPPEQIPLEANLRPKTCTDLLLAANVGEQGIVLYIRSKYKRLKCGVSESLFRPARSGCCVVGVWRAQYGSILILRYKQQVNTIPQICRQATPIPTAPMINRWSARNCSSLVMQPPSTL